jgi:hypothetical protein
VTFHYDFVINDKVANLGVEHWQVRKIDGQWKILSVTWTSYDRSWQPTAGAAAMSLTFVYVLFIPAGLMKSFSTWRTGNA